MLGHLDRWPVTIAMHAGHPGHGRRTSGWPTTPALRLLLRTVS